jgi:antitoxin (DNA-binding transcriptional repressor) of toxin-antitoxin stability system
MKTVTLDDLDGRLNEHLLGLNDGEELTITVNGEPYARLTRLARTSWPSRAGTAKHPDNWMAPDFNAPMNEYGEYAG